MGLLPEFLKGAEKKQHYCASCGSTLHLKRFPAPPPRFWTWVCIPCWNIMKKNRKEVIDEVKKAKKAGKGADIAFKEIVEKLTADLSRDKNE